MTKFFSQIPFLVFSGDPIPRIRYTPVEVSTWREVFRKAVELYPGRACRIHRKVIL